MPMSEAEALAQRQSQLASFAGEGGLSPSELPDLIRWTNPQTYPATLAACMTEAGVPATPRPGGAEFAVAGAQKDASMRVHAMCAAKYTLHPYYGRPMSSAALDHYYDWVVSTVACLRKVGSPVPEVPSREVWIASNVSAVPVLPWDKLNEQGMERKEREMLEKQCPAYPSSTILMSWLEHNPVLVK